MYAWIRSFAVVLALGPPAIVAQTIPPVPNPPAAPTTRTHGINLSGAVMSYDARHLPFADLVKMGSRFSGYKGTRPNPPYDAEGWPTKVDAATGSTQFIVGLNGILPKGDYVFVAKGKGSVVVTGNFTGKTFSSVTFNGDELPRKLNRPFAGVNPQGQIDVIFTASDPADPVRDLRIYLPGHEGKKFNQAFLDDVAPFNTIRIMDWQSTNGSTIKEWPDRLKPGFSYYQKGRVPEEDAIDLANETGKDLWLCIPALASDDYVVKLAGLVHEKLNINRSIYIEFSNEVWNFAMPQWPQLEAMRQADPNKIAPWEWIARRDGRLVNVFKASVPADRKCYRVLARQNGYVATLTVAMNQYKADGYGFDVIASAPYFYSGLNMLTLAEQFKSDPDGALTRIFADVAKVNAEQAGYARWFHAQAKANNARYAIYEAGQHFIGPTGRDEPVAMLTAAQRDPRMADAYRQFFALLPPDVGPICWFYDAAGWSKWGWWGHKEYTGQPTEQAPKYAAVVADIEAGKVVPPPDPEPEPEPPPAPDLNPVFVQLAALGFDGAAKSRPDGSLDVTTKDPADPAKHVTRHFVLATPAPVPEPEPAPDPEPEPEPVPAPAPIVVPNGGFESPRLAAGSFGAPTGALWLFEGSGFAGISAADSGFTFRAPAAPEGRQVAVLQNRGRIHVPIQVVGPGSYVVTFRATGRANQGGRNDFRVNIGGNAAGRFAPVPGPYVEYRSDPVTLGVGFNPLTFTGLNTAGGDNTSLIDDVKVIPAAPVGP